MGSCTCVSRLRADWRLATMPLLLFTYLLLPPLALLRLLLLPLLLLLTFMFLLLSLLLSKFRVLPSRCRWTAPPSLFLLRPRPTVGAFVLRLRLRCRSLTGVAVHNLASDNARPA